MAKTSVVMRNLKRMRKVKLAGKARQALKEQIRVQPDTVEETVIKLQKRDRNESPIRVRHRCRSCGRPHGTLKKVWFMSHLSASSSHAW